MNLELWKMGALKDTHSVIEMGSQGLHLKLADLEELLQMAGITNYKKENFAGLANYPLGQGCSARIFYDLLGIKEYACIDLNKEYGSIPLDLNSPLEDRSLYGKYDLVTDYGTNEHVFNTAEAYRTMHKLCKPGGILMIGQVVYRGNGYYAYDPSFFEGIAAANDYKIIFSSYVVVSTVPTKNGSSNQFHLPLSRELLDILDWTKTYELGIFYAMQKQSESEFNTPYQGGLLSTKGGNYGYKLAYSQNSLGRSYLPLHSLKEFSGKLIFTTLCGRVLRRLKKHL